MIVTIIIPTYNRQDTIREALLSVLNQSIKDIEIIVIDDNSNDNTEHIIKEINDDRVIYIKSDNNYGACTSRNIGINIARGKYIAFQDSDDIWYLNKLELQIEFLKKNNADIVFCAMRRVDKERWSKFPNFKIDGLVNYSDFLQENKAGTVTILGDAKCFKDIYFDPEMPRLQDWDLMIRLSKKYRIVYQNKILVDSFVQHDSISKSPEKGIIAFRRLLQKNADEIENNKKVKAFYWKRIGDLEAEMGSNPNKSYVISLRTQFKIKTLLLLFISKIGLTNTAKKIIIFFLKKRQSN